MNPQNEKAVHWQLVSKVVPEDPSTWLGKVLVTIDLDWCDDKVLEDTLELLETVGVKATWFVTHETRMIERLRSSGHELGIHPNFNPLLDGSSVGTRDVREILARCLDFVPDARAVRSHSLAQSERVLDVFSELGLDYVCNTFFPLSASIQAKPFRMWDELVIIPHVWQDNVSLRLGEPPPSTVIPYQGMLVLDFHPIHIFLNTESLIRYENSRYLHSSPETLLQLRYPQSGIRTAFVDVLGKVVHQ